MTNLLEVPTESLDKSNMSSASENHWFDVVDPNFPIVLFIFREKVRFQISSLPGMVFLITKITNFINKCTLYENHQDICILETNKSKNGTDEKYMKKYIEWRQNHTQHFLFDFSLFLSISEPVPHLPWIIPVKNQTTGEILSLIYRFEFVNIPPISLCGTIYNNSILFFHIYYEMKCAVLINHAYTYERMLESFIYSYKGSIFYKEPHMIPHCLIYTLQLGTQIETVKNSSYQIKKWIQSIKTKPLFIPHLRIINETPQPFHQESIPFFEELVSHIFSAQNFNYGEIRVDKKLTPEIVQWDFFFVHFVCKHLFFYQQKEILLVLDSKTPFKIDTNMLANALTFTLVNIQFKSNVEFLLNWQEILQMFAYSETIVSIKTSRLDLKSVLEKMINQQDLSIEIYEQGTHLTLFKLIKMLDDFFNQEGLT